MADEAEQVFQLIKNDKAQEDHFFEVLADTSNPLPWLKPLVEGDYFNPKNNPPPAEVLDQKGFFTIPRWNVLGYLENVASQNAKTPNDEVTETLLKIVDFIIKYRDEAGERIDNYVTDCSVIRVIFTFPVDKLTDDHIEFVRESLHSKWRTVSIVTSELGKTAFPQLIKNDARELLLKLIDVVFDYEKKDKKSLDEYTSIIDEYWLNDLLEKHKPGIAKLCSIEAADVALAKMRAIVSEDAKQFHLARIPTIEDHEQMHFPNGYECQLVRFVRDMYGFSDPKHLKEKIITLIKEEHPIFKRIAIHIINQHYNELNDLFWKWKGNPLEGKWLKHELYELLKARCKSFLKEQTRTVLKWIETKKYFVPDEVKEELEREKILAYRKKEWLSALLDTKDEDILSAYEKYDAIVPGPLTHPGFDYWMETSWGGAAARINKEELLQKSNEELAKYLDAFKETGKWKEPDREDLSRAFRECVASEPERFSTELEPFLEIDRMYKYALIWGLYDAWHAKKDFPWDNVIKFISNLITTEEFWEETKGTERYNYRDQTVGQIADLLKEGTQDDKHAFDPELLPAAEKLLLTLAKKTESHIEPKAEEDNDFMNLALNSLRGRLLSAMVSYSLRYARLYGKDGERWVEAIKRFFQDYLSGKTQPPIEYFITLGHFLPSFYYLDKKWVTDKINEIFPKDDDRAWEAAFTGYVYSTNAVYQDLYALLRENNHYEKGLQTTFSDDHCIQRIVGHICVGYLEDWEKLEDSASLVTQLINCNSIKIFSEIINFFWMIRDKLTDKIRVKIKPLWKSIIGVLLQGEQDIEYKKAISDLSKWLSLIDTIDEEILEWLKHSAKYIETNYNSPFLVEYLLPHVETTPDKVGQVFLSMLDNNIYPHYKKEDIENIVRGLYAQKQRQIADTICNSYLEKGIIFLKPIYEENMDRTRDIGS